MSTVRSCFAATVSFLVVAIGCSAADAVVCCNSSSVTSGGQIASCKNENRKFHMIEAIEGGTCVDNETTAVLVRKCCPPGQPYDPEVRFCGPAGADGDVYLRQMMQRLRKGFRAVADAVMLGYEYNQPLCDKASVLVDVPAVEVLELMEADPPAFELPPDYCFDLTSSNELVARACRPRDQYCGRDRYTCVNKCCKGGDRMLTADGQKCKQSEKPFTVPVYETDADGRPMGRSNSTVLPYYLRLNCSNRIMVDDVFMSTTDGSLYLKGNDQSVPAIEYCVEYSAAAEPQVAPDLQAFVCTSDIKPPSTAEDTRGSWKYVILLVGFVPSVVCLVLTLIVYAILPSLRNVHGYNVMCYVACLLVSIVCIMILQWTQTLTKSQYCILYGYFTLFGFLTTFCWLNVICFDIYWMIRYNNSRSRRRSISVRTIMYHIYCWGFSSIWASTGYLFQHSQHETLLKLAPDFGHRSCWFFEHTSNGILIFFIIPVSAMLTVNLILFLLTAIHCSRIKSELNKFKQTDDSKKQSFLVDKEKFVMSGRLFLVMGIPWSFEMISKFFPSEWIIWVILDEINALQGVMIFIIFVAKSKIIMNLRKKFRGSMYHSESTKMTTVSGSSQSGCTNKSCND